jgi:hypothetical protein
LNVLLVRAGALGDLLLLRPTIAALGAAGHRVRLLAPEQPGSVLRGPGTAHVLALDRAEVADALAEGFGDGPVARALSEADVVVAYTRSAPLLERLAERARRLIVHDPAPPAQGPHAADWLMRAVAPLMGPVPSPAARFPTPVLAFSEQECRDADARTAALPRGFLAVHPGSGSPSKNWPMPHFLEAARRLSGASPWLLVAGPAEEALVARRGARPRRPLPRQRCRRVAPRRGCGRPDARALRPDRPRALGARGAEGFDPARPERLAGPPRARPGGRRRPAAQVRGERTSILLISR